MKRGALLSPSLYNWKKMANFTFKKEDVKVYVVHNNLQYLIDTSEIEFGQTFAQKSFNVKTIQSQSSFEGAITNRANPAEFSLNIPLIKEPYFKVLFDRLLDSASFDLYISSQYDVWKLEKCFIQDGSFEINKSRPLRLSIEGEASKLSKHTSTASNVALSAMQHKRVIIISKGDTDFTSVGSPSNKVGTIFTATANLSAGTGLVRQVAPGTLQYADQANVRTYIVPALNTLTVGGDDVSSCVTTLSVEVQNDLNWNKYNTVQGARSSIDAETSMYPTTYFSGTKVVAGSIKKYLKEDSSDVLTWNTNTPIRIKAGKVIDSVFYGIDFNMNKCAFTNRIEISTMFMEEYNWRMTQNVTALSSVITYNTT